jgi:mRNA interferase HigB
MVGADQLPVLKTVEVPEHAYPRAIVGRGDIGMRFMPILSASQAVNGTFAASPRNRPQIRSGRGRAFVCGQCLESKPPGHLAIVFSGFAKYNPRSHPRFSCQELRMHVISRRRLREFWEVHADSEQALTRWYKLASKAEWASFAELKADCPSADQVDHLTVVDIGGNKYRLIVEVFFRDQVVLVRHVLTHKDYDKGKWKV